MGPPGEMSGKETHIMPKACGCIRMCEQQGRMSLQPHVRQLRTELCLVLPECAHACPPARGLTADDAGDSVHAGRAVPAVEHVLHATVWH